MSFLNSVFGGKAPKMVEIRSAGVRFEVPAGKTILESALAAGVAFPHDCTVGTCGTCKSRLLLGRVHELSEFAYTLSSEELAAHFILPCQSIPKDSLVRLDVTLDSQAQERSRPYRGTIADTRHLTHDILSIELDLDRPIEYVAGQYANLRAPSCARARSYSFSRPAPVGGTTRVSLCIRKVPGGEFTEALFARRLDGLSLQLEGPHGGFRLHESGGAMICVAGGSGLAPIISLLEDAAARRIARPAILLFGARTAQDLYFLERIAAVASAWAGPFTFIPVLSHEPPGSAWAGARGQVTDFIPDALARYERLGAQGYLCGPPGMIDVGLGVMTQCGLGLDALFYDKFTDSSTLARV